MESEGKISSAFAYKVASFTPASSFHLSPHFLWEE